MTTEYIRIHFHCSPPLSRLSILRAVFIPFLSENL